MAEDKPHADGRLNFFISYNRADQAWAEWIAWQLEDAGYTTRLQAWDFRPGSNFVEEMDRAVQEAERTIAVLSLDYLTALYTRPEWQAAFAQDPTGATRQLLPVRIRPCELQGLLAQIVYIDLVDQPEDTAKETLLSGLSPDRTKPAIAPTFPGQAHKPMSASPRFPGSLPPIWNVPYNRNPNFTGREELLTQLHTTLLSDDQTVLTQAISGLGGIGKTQLALEYAYRYAGEYHLVWWVEAEEPATLAAEYAGLAQALHLPVASETEQRVIVAAVRQWLGQHGGWLLIFDNVSAREAVETYLPQGQAGQVLLTSRNPNWGDTAAVLPVQVWESAESVAFLHKRVQSPTEVAQAIADELGHLPLALEQASAYITATRITAAAYLTLFRARYHDLWAEEESPRDYPATVATTWTLTMARLAADSPASVALLHLCAYLGPEAIPRTLVMEGASVLPDALAETETDSLVLNRAVGALQRYSLLSSQGESWTVHRLVQAVVRERQSEAERKQWATVAVELVTRAFDFNSQEVTNWPISAQLLPHALSAAQHAETLQVAAEPTAKVLNQAGLYLYSAGGE